MVVFHHSNLGGGTFLTLKSLSVKVTTHTMAIAATTKASTNNGQVPLSQKFGLLEVDMSIAGKQLKEVQRSSTVQVRKNRTHIQSSNICAQKEVCESVLWNAIAVLRDTLYYVLWVCHYMLWFRHYMLWVCHYMLWFRHYML